MAHTIISYSNIKTGAIPSFSFPPVVTCANCTECMKDCYALKMTRFHKSVGVCWRKNLELWQTNKKAVEYAIISSAMMSRYFRYFIGGDIVDMDFLDMMCKIAVICSHCKFLCFTKKYDMVNEYFNHFGMPSNLQIIFSCWGNQIPANPHNLPMSNVIFDKKTPSYGYVCGGNCGNCIHQGLGCWQLQKGDIVWFYKH